MRILVIGSGGREHAIGWKLAQSSSAKKLFFAPGNGGTSAIGENVDIKASDIPELLNFAINKNIDLTVVGSDEPISLGIVDQFQKKGLKIFGPTKYAAQLESSKAWAVKFMQEYRIPHPDSFVVRSLEEGISFVRKPKWEHYVIKASGLAAGKGVHLPDSPEEAEKSVKEMMKDKIFGAAGDVVVFQERLSGPEVSVMAIIDGKNYQLLPLAQDHKRIFDNDKGPNTGGMGSYAPAGFVDGKLLARIESEIIQPTIFGMKQEGHPYNGFLYFGLMIVDNTPYVIEYNARLGDPETQSQLPLVKSDLVKVLLSCIDGDISRLAITSEAAVTVVLAAPGYPEKPKTGQVIHGLDSVKKNKNIVLFHAGTINENGVIKVSGGRSINIVGLGDNIEEAHAKAYKVIGKENNGVYFDNMHYRKDIAHYAI